jgi:hypothetical protein
MCEKPYGGCYSNIAPSYVKCGVLKKSKYFYTFGLIVIKLLVEQGVEGNPGPFDAKDLAEIMEAMKIVTNEQTAVLQDNISTMNETMREYKKLNEDQHDEIINEVNNIRAENKHLSAKIEAMEGSKRKNNIIVFGIEEHDNFDAENKIRELCRELRVNIGPDSIGETFRMGRNKGARPILCKFTSFKTKLDVMSANRRNDFTYAISQDLSQTERDTRKKLLPYRDDVRRGGDEAIIRGSLLYINNEKWTLDRLTEWYMERYGYPAPNMEGARHERQTAAGLPHGPPAQTVLEPVASTSQQGHPRDTTHSPPPIVGGVRISFSNTLKAPAARQSEKKQMAIRPPSTSSLPVNTYNPPTLRSTRMEIDTPAGNNRPKRGGANTSGKTDNVENNLSGLRQQAQESLSEQNKRMRLSAKNN